MAETRRSANVAAGMQERELLSVLRLVALALDKHPNIFCGGQRAAVAALFQRLLPILCQQLRSRCSGHLKPQILDRISAVHDLHCAREPYGPPGNSRVQFPAHLLGRPSNFFLTREPLNPLLDLPERSPPLSTARRSVTKRLKIKAGLPPLPPMCLKPPVGVAV